MSVEINANYMLGFSISSLVKGVGIGKPIGPSYEIGRRLGGEEYIGHWEIKIREIKFMLEEMKVDDSWNVKLWEYGRNCSSQPIGVISGIENIITWVWVAGGYQSGKKGVEVG